MATRGFENTTAADLLRGKVGRKSAMLPQERSKYRNVKVVVGGEAFDSKAEAAYWMGLLARQRAGEIAELQRQVPFPLFCCGTIVEGGERVFLQVTEYLADYVFLDRAGVLHVQDKKSKATRTAVYKLKKKWLELQDGIVIEEV